MTTRNLNALFAPRAIAVVGASAKEGSVGNVLTRNLVGAGFSGPIMPVNVHAGDICGLKTYRTIADLPDMPDLAVIATPPASVPGLIGDLGQRGCRAAVVITAGLDHALRDAMLAAGRPHLMRIVGPNCLGFLSPISGINASFAHRTPLKGRLAFLTQSGAIATSIIDWGLGRGIGFSHIISLGDMADVDFGDLLDFLALDPDTGAILLYAETITQARKFMSAGRIAARAKPVIVVKGGRSRSGAAAAASHTGALAGADAVYDAVFRRAGMLRVKTLRELFDAAETLASGLHIPGSQLTIVTNGGGLGVLAADALDELGGSLVEIAPETRAQLDHILPRGWSHANPIDIIGDAPGKRYEDTLDVLASGAGNSAILVMNCPTGIADSLEAAQAVVRFRQAQPQRPVLGCWMGEATTPAPRALLSGERIPNYETPDEAIAAFMHLANYASTQRALFETPSAELRMGANRREEAGKIIASAIGEGRETLTEPEAKAVLGAYQIPVVATQVARTPAEAARAAAEIGGRIALKILSRDITHKSDVGGVRLGLSGATETLQAADEMLRRIQRARPEARVDGFTVQEMIDRPHAQELLLGAIVDPTFGACLLFGQGGVATEIVADRCMGLAPLTANLAHDMIAHTRVARLLAGYRDRKPARLDAVAATLVALSDLVTDFREIAELDINPLLADADGVIALDARIIIRRPTPATPPLAIRPYPAELAHSVALEGATFRLRPIRPEDAGRLLEMARQTHPDDLRLRFHGAVATATEATTARLSQIDYDREMAFVAEMAGGTIGGVVRLVFDPNFETAECAIIVRTDLQRTGIGAELLSASLAYARTRGAARVWGEIMTGNERMQALALSLGGRIQQLSDDPGLARVEFDLKEPDSAPAPGPD